MSKHQKTSENRMVFETWKGGSVFVAYSEIRKRHDILSCILRFLFLKVKV